MSPNAILRSTWADLVTGTVTYLIVRPWQEKVASIVPEPYLDEVFHVPQAQAYCNGRFTQWDPKITTPPGLYLISSIVAYVTGCCSTACLRSHNALSLALLAIASRRLLLKIGQVDSERHGTPSFDWNVVHKSINLAMFPCLFFFSALYYTDIASALTVLLFLQAFSSSNPHWANTMWQVVLAMVSLTFRQTNIFWVGIFPAGLALIRNAERTSKSERQPLNHADWQTVLLEGWQKGYFYDRNVADAGLQDYAKMALSLIVVSVRVPRRTLAMLSPHLFVLTAFATFVVWNGGVVLGDKSHHVATIHIAQMLYLWPYIVFFSWPATLPVLWRSIHGLLPPSVQPESIKRDARPRLLTFSIICGIAVAVIHYNTIVHPFTLADNRHYTFYVFRLLLRNRVTKYGAAFVYVFCAWLSIQSLGRGDTNKEAKGVRSVKDTKDKKVESDGESCKVSFVAVWLITSSLSLITAPLVEPRYFIVPWIVWRLNVPVRGVAGSAVGPVVRATKTLLGASSLLWLETAWSMFVNLATGYIFLYRGFAWPQEPGKMQRFMW